MYNLFLQSINILIPFNVEKDHINENKIIYWTTFVAEKNRTNMTTAYIKMNRFVVYVCECIYLSIL